MNYEKIEVALHHLQAVDEHARCARSLLNEILAEYDAQNDVAEYKRSLFRFVDDTMRPFPSILQTKTPDAGTPDEEQGFVEFTDKEIEQMPKKFRRIILCNRKRCRMRVHESGKNTTTYEIRYRREGYELSACGKTIELAKAKMIEKMKTAKPKAKNEIATVPTNFKDFTLFYFEKFRKPKVAEQTYYNDFNRLNNHIFPAFGSLNITQVSPTLCQDLIDKLRAQEKYKTAEEIYSLLSVIFRGAIAHALIERNPLDIVLRFKHENEHGKALTRAEEKSLLSKVKGTPRGILYAILLYTGLRPNELKTITIKGSFIIAVNSKRKNKKIEYKLIFICKKLVAQLEGITDIPKLHDKYISTEFPKFCPGHKLYDLRTTFNTRCKELGVADHARMHFMGHSLGALGNAYTDLSDEYLLSEGKKLNNW